MREVSCRVLDGFFKLAKRKGVDPNQLILEVPHPLAHLTNRNERIEWDSFVTFMRNATALFDEQELEDLGRTFLRSPLLSPLTLVARALFGTSDFYRWVCEKGSGAGNLMFTCVTPTFEKIADGRYRIGLNLRAGYVSCPGFFTVSRGTFSEMPRILGLPAAQVSFTSTAQGADYEIAVKEQDSWFSRLVRWFSPRSAHLAARELKLAHEELQSRYQEIEAARARLDEQAKRLLTSHEVSRVIHGEFDVQSTLAAVSLALVETAGFASASVRIQPTGDGQSQGFQSSHGPQQERAADISAVLQTRGVQFGHVELWIRPSTELASAQEALEFIVPTISMALDEAITFTALSDYRKNLEAKVAARTQELQEANEKLERNYAELVAAQQTRERIFANINHDLKTPLSLVMLGVDVIKMREGDRLQPRSLEDLQAIETSGHRLLRLIDELLALAASQEDKLKISLAKHDVGNMLRLITNSWQPAANKFNIALSYDGPATLLADVDGSAFERIITNLLSNAIKFTPPGGSVVIHAHETNNMLHIEVRDTGIGLTDEFKSRVFGRFERDQDAVNPTSKSSGLGLALVKTLANAHSGTANVASTVGRGTTFFINLPLRHLGVSAQGTAPQLSLSPTDYGLRIAPLADNNVSGVIAGSNNATAPTALVAEDDPELRAKLIEVLGKDYRIIVAEDGNKALELAKQHLPDVLISDVGMPGMDGYELCRQFRQLPGNRLAPVLLLTAYGSVKSRITGLESGAVDYVLKPFDPEELRARVRNQLNVRDLALRLFQAERVASLSVLSSGLAHEIRNPANGIVNAVAPLKNLLAQESLNERDSINQLLEVIGESAVQIRYLSKNLLGFRHSGELQLKAESMVSIIRRAITMTPERPGVVLQDNSEFRGDLACAGPLVSQAISNLLDNASKACGDAGTVSVNAQLQGDWLHIIVEDDGPGIPSELSERIFDPFFTTRAPHKGIGLGLSTAREIAAGHGGALTVVPATRGAKFVLRLPFGENVRPPPTAPFVGSAPLAAQQRRID